MPVDARPEHRQRAYRVRLEWGREGAELLAAECAAVIVVDVLSFCTAVDVAVGRGAAILPQPVRRRYRRRRGSAGPGPRRAARGAP